MLILDTWVGTRIQGCHRFLICPFFETSEIRKNHILLIYGAKMLEAERIIIDRNYLNIQHIHVV